MLPIRDHNPSGRTPFVTYGLMAANIAVFLLVLLPVQEPWRLNAIYMDYAILPAAITQGFAYQTLVTSMFLHAGWLHLIGNMLYLWIFAKGVENEMGYLRFTAFYLLCGVIASLSHIASQPESIIPAIGASGAISGVMGAYLRLNPEAKILTVFVLPGTLIRLVQVPAFMYLIHFIFFQMVQGFYLSRLPFSDGGVAWFAHIGGFFAGLFLAKYFKKPAFLLWGIF